MTFDRLIYIDRLKEAGVPEPVARAHAEALRDALFETVATKSDLSEAVQATRADLNEAVRTTRADLNEAMQATRADLNEAIQATRADLHEAVRTTRADLNEAMQATRADLKQAVQTLDHKIDITARDLIIKGAAALVVIASLIVGLKLFG